MHYAVRYHTIVTQHPTHGPGKTFMEIKYVFLDRDGVINRKPPEGSYIKSWSEFHPLPRAEQAIAALNASGRTVIVVTNQRGVALGLYSEKDVTEIHRRLQDHLSGYSAHIDAFYYCPHDKNKCDCRKPATGLFERAFRDFPQASAANSILIGDSVSDVEAARRLSMPSIFIIGDPLYRKSGAEQAAALATVTEDSLAKAVERYLS